MTAEELKYINNDDTVDMSLPDDNECNYGFPKKETRKDSKKSFKNANVNEKIKAPTLEEINELKETRNLFHSNLFRLQVKEMLMELNIKEKYTKFIHTWMSELQSFLKNIKSQEARENIFELKWLQQCALQIPLALSHTQLGATHEKKQKQQFQFIKPKIDAYLVGAASTRTLFGSKLVVDVCIEMPAECIQKDNYLNMAYDKKRGLYLMYLGMKMIQSKHFFNGLTEKHLNFSYHANNPLKPVLEVTPQIETHGKSISSKVRVRIFISLEEKAFKLSRFVPWNSNIRNLYCQSTNNGNTIPLCTPSYNSNILFDLTMKRNQKVVQEFIGNNKNIQEGFILLKVWLQQRQLNIGYSGFGAHIFAMYIIYLYKERKLHPNMSNYQVVRTVWNQMAHSAWNEDGKGITLCDDHTDSRPSLEQFHTYFDVVFIDITGYYNICSQLSSQFYNRVRQECKWAVDMLNDAKVNSFQLLFMVKYPLYMQFDHMLKINNKETIEQLLELHVQPGERCDYNDHSYPQLLKLITGLLVKGLGKRVDYIIPIQETIDSWPVHMKPPICGHHLHIGLILNPEYACEVIDKGPESVSGNADDYRQFWGDKAKLRRFQDGTITESIVWGPINAPLSHKRLVVRSIVLHLLQHHFQLNANDVEYVGGELDVVYRLTSAFKTEQLQERYKDIESCSDSEFLALRVIRCFDDLTRKLRDLKELPLEITSITGISPIFRYCELEPVLPMARFAGDKLLAAHVHHAIIQLSASSKWPSELDALRALKTAFYFQIAKLLQQKFRLRSQVTYDGVLVLKQGYCFRIELAHPKEVALLQREASTLSDDNAKIVKYDDCEESIALERRQYVLPRINGTIHAIYQEQPSFGPTVAIAKRWLYAQLIDNGVWPDECTELLIASQFLKQYIQQPSCSPQTGFIRFLHLLANTDWRTEMCFINFQNCMNEKELIELECNFNAQRDSFPPLCIATSYDQRHYGKLWTSMERPNNYILARVTMLARESLDIIESILMSQTSRAGKLVHVFQASSAGYNHVIQLKPDMLANTLASNLGSPFAALTKPNWRLPVADLQLLQKAVLCLRESYSDYAAFFYNPCGGKEIAIVWKPHINIKRDFKVTEVNGCSLNSNGDQLEYRKSTLIQDFKFILKDLYLSVGPPYNLTSSQPSIVVQKKDFKSVKMKKRYFNANTYAPAFPTKRCKIEPNVDKY